MRGKKAVENYNIFLNSGTELTLDEYYFEHMRATNEKLSFVRKSIDEVIQYYVPPQDSKLLSDNWMDILLSGSETEFETEKNTPVIERVLNWITLPDSIILDSFAGSGTTAHAVLNLNQEDGGNRKFILIEMEDYAETLTAERVRRVMAGYGDKEGTGGGFDFYTLGEPLFREDGLLNEEVGEAAIRRYVRHAETRSPAVAVGEGGSLQHPWLLGVHEGTAWWFCYDREQAVVLDIELLSTILAAKTGETAVVYADYCTLPDDLMQARGIRFKKIPRDIPRL